MQNPRATVPVSCLGCRRKVRYPKARLRLMETQAVFCSTECNQRYLAVEGAKQFAQAHED